MRWQSAAWAVVVVVAVVGELFHSLAGDAALTWTTHANSLCARSASLDLMAISARFALLQQYDALVDAEKMVEVEIEVFRAAPSPPAITTALDSFEKAFRTRQADLQMLKDNRAVLTNTERYLQRLLDDLRKSDPADPRVAEAIRLVLAWQLARNDDDASLHALQQFSDELRKGSPSDPMTALIPHLNALVSMRRALVDITRQQLVKTPLAVASNEVVIAVSAVAAEHQAQAQKTRLALLGLAVALTLAMLWIPPRRWPRRESAGDKSIQPQQRS